MDLLSILSHTICFSASPSSVDKHATLSLKHNFSTAETDKDCLVSLNMVVLGIMRNCGREHPVLSLPRQYSSRRAWLFFSCVGTGG